MVTVTSSDRNPGLQAHPSSMSGHDGSLSFDNGSPSDVAEGLAQSAHQAPDRLREQVTPPEPEMPDGSPDEAREVTDEWVQTLRCTLRENPLAAVGTAFAVGLLIARLLR